MANTGAVFKCEHCELAAVSKGLCAGHYAKWYRRQNGETKGSVKSFYEHVWKDCLRCGKVFPSISKVNRLCHDCNEANKRVSDVEYRVSMERR